MEEDAAAVNEYEAQRARRIAKNRERMERLGLLQASAAFFGSVPGASSLNVVLGDGDEPKPKKRKLTKPVGHLGMRLAAAVALLEIAGRQAALRSLGLGGG